MNYSPYSQDYIPADLFNIASKNILEWIQNNRDSIEWAKDPNAHEMVNLFLFGAKYSYEGIDIDTKTLTQIWNIRSKDFKNCNVSENNFIYSICQDAYHAAINGERIVNDEDSHDALRSMARIGLYLKQQQRDSGEVSYNNPSELSRLLSSSKTLKDFHPDLFEKYAFGKNLDVLCRLQLSQEITPQQAKDIKQYQQELYEKDAEPHFQNVSIDDAKYFCSKISKDAYKVSEFLRKYEIQVNQNIENSENEYRSPAHSYYYSLYFELSHALGDFLDEKCSSENFQRIFDSIYNKYNVDLDELSATIERLEDPSLQQEHPKFFKALDSKALEYFENKRNKISQGNDTR